MSKKIGIIGAMNKEIESLADLLDDRRDTLCSGVNFHEGKLCGVDVVLAVSGVGKVFAAICAQTMIVRFGASVIVNTGVAGSADESLRICDAVIAQRTVQHDMDTSPLGDPIGLISGINKVYIDCDEKVVAALESSVAKTDTRYIKGTIASGDVFVASEEKKRAIKQAFGAAACEMEGAAIGQACYINGVPFGVLRIISDSCGEMDYMTFSDIAAEKGKQIVLEFLKEYK